MNITYHRSSVKKNLRVIDLTELVKESDNSRRRSNSNNRFFRRRREAAKAEAPTKTTHKGGMESSLLCSYEKKISKVE